MNAYLEIRARIAAKTDRKNNLLRLWEGINKLNEELKFSMDCYQEIKARIDSEVSECERVIFNESIKIRK